MINFTSTSAKRGTVECGAAIQYRYMREISKTLSLCIQLFALLLFALFLYALVSGVVFEDGSFVLGPLHGCLPGGICNGS